MQCNGKYDFLKTVKKMTPTQITHCHQEQQTTDVALV